MKYCIPTLLLSSSFAVWARDLGLVAENPHCADECRWTHGSFRGPDGSLKYRGG